MSVRRGHCILLIRVRLCPPLLCVGCQCGVCLARCFAPELHASGSEAGGLRQTDTGGWRLQTSIRCMFATTYWIRCDSPLACAACNARRPQALGNGLSPPRLWMYCIADVAGVKDCERVVCACVCLCESGLFWSHSCGVCVLAQLCTLVWSCAAGKQQRRRRPGPGRRRRHRRKPRGGVFRDDLSWCSESVFTSCISPVARSSL